MDIPVLFIVIVGLIIALCVLLALTVRLTRTCLKLRSEKRSTDVRRGFMTEQWLPLVAPYPWDPRNLKFLGQPVDGVQFEDDKVIFVEFKSGASQLSEKQKRMRELVRAGRVEFREIRVRLDGKSFDRLEVH